MNISITPEFIEKTIKKPDTILNCENKGLAIYIKKINNLGELLVVAKKENTNEYDIKCFDWVTPIKFKF